MSTPRHAPRPKPTRRQERRAIERLERRRTPVSAATPAWRSPMALLTGGAVLVGAVVVGAIVLFGQPSTSLKPTGGSSLPQDLVRPLATIPTGLAQNDRTLGVATAPVTLEIWSDFQCPACERLATLTEPSIIDTFVATGTLKLVYRDAAFQGQKSSNPWDESVAAAAAARCAGDQNRFWEFHNWLFANQEGENVGSFAKERLRAVAEQVGIDLTTYDACMNDGSKQAAVRQETNAAVASGIDSTPTMAINGQRQVGALGYDELTQLIRAAAASAAPAGSAVPSGSSSPSPTGS
jgi:protein-disulfide isomerase